jgi:prepilin-type N-terminal cleavage/methylation domain-containing protein
MRSRCSGEKGFSLVEMMVAMLITVIVSAAIFGLMTAGQTAFKREPARSDRQQNMRAAMDIIQRDIAAAGGGLSPWVQAFSVGDGIGNEAGPLLLNAGPNGSDRLQIFGADGSCPGIRTDATAGPFQAVPCPTTGCGNTVYISQVLPACYGPAAGPVLVGLRAPNSFFVGSGVPAGTVGGGPAAALRLDFSGTQSRLRRCGGTPLPGPGTCPGPPTDATDVTPIQIVRYEIAADFPPAGGGDGILGLWRSATGGINPATGLPVAAPLAAGNWQLVGRGIEDMGIVYTPAGVVPAPVVNPGFPNPLPGNSPPIVVPGTFTTLTWQVQVTLTGRTIMEGPNRLAGTDDIRSQLSAVVTPRAALAALSTAVPPIWQ